MPEAPAAVTTTVTYLRKGLIAGRARTRLGRSGFLVCDQARGGWNGGAEEMPERVAAAMIADSDWSAITDSRVSGTLIIASGLGAQTEASAQFGAGDSVWTRVL